MHRYCINRINRRSRINRRLHERNSQIEKQMHDLFVQFVPDVGTADTYAGEIIRAANRIAGRFYNDGDMISSDNGEYVAAPAGYLFTKFQKTYGIGSIISQMSEMGAVGNTVQYESLLNDLCATVIAIITDYPEYEDRPNNDDCTNDAKWGKYFPAEDYSDYDEDEDDWVW